MSQHDAVKGMHTEGLVTSDHVQGKGGMKLKLSRWWMYGVALVAVLLAAGGFYYYMMYLRPASSTFPTLDSSRPIADQAQAQLKAASNPTEKAIAYESFAAAYMEKHQTAQAIDAYQKALSYTPDNTGVLSELSAAYVQAGDKTKAIDALQKIVTILQASTNSKVRDLAPYYQGQIDQLKGSK